MEHDTNNKGVPTIKELATKLGFKKSDDFLSFIGYTAQNMSTTKKKNYSRYVSILKLAVLDKFGMSINDVVEASIKHKKR